MQKECCGFAVNKVILAKTDRSHWMFGKALDAESSVDDSLRVLTYGPQLRCTVFVKVSISCHTRSLLYPPHPHQVPQADLLSIY